MSALQGIDPCPHCGCHLPGSHVTLHPRHMVALIQIPEIVYTKRDGYAGDYHCMACGTVYKVSADVGPK